MEKARKAPNFEQQKHMDRPSANTWDTQTQFLCMVGGGDPEPGNFQN